MRPAVFTGFCFMLLLSPPALAQAPATPPEGEESPTLELPAVEPPAIGWMLSLAEMEAAGAIIGEIRIRPQNIFDLTDPRENNFLYRIANGIHVTTREGVVRRTLLFKSGDKLSVRLIEESERIMRALLQI